MMENEGEQSEATTEQQIDQQELVNENEAGGQDAANANGRANSDEEEPIKADPSVTDEQSKSTHQITLYVFAQYIFALLSATTSSRMLCFRIKGHNLNYIFIVDTVTDAATGQAEAVNIAKEEEPDEVDLNSTNNPFILPGA